MATLLAAAENAEVAGATADAGPRPTTLAAARRRRHRHGRRDREAARGRHRGVRDAVRQADRGRGVEQGGGGHRPPVHHGVVAARRARGAAGQARRARRGGGRGAPGLEQGRDAVGRPRARDRRPARLARRSPIAMLERVGRPAGVRRRGRSPTGFTDAALLGMGGSSLGPEVIRRSFGDAGRARPCTCWTPPTRARCWSWSARSTCRRRCSSSPRSPAARWRRSPTCSTSTSARAAAGDAVRGRHRPGLRAGGPGPRARLQARVRERPQHRRALLGAVLLRPGARRAWRAWTCGRCWSPRRRPSRTATTSTPARPTPACGWGWPWRSWRSRAATSSRSSSQSRSPASGCGSSS